jgi:hypothetical protein
MVCDGSDVVNEVAGVTTLRTTYVGKLYDMGKPSIGSSTHQGEISWTSYAGMNTYVQTQGVQAGGPKGTEKDDDGNLIPAVAPVIGVEFISYTWLARYIITTAVYKTMTRNSDPNQVIGSGGGSWRVTSEFPTGRVSNTSGAGMITGHLTFPTILLDSNKQPLNNGWFELTSTWGPQPEIQVILANIPTPPQSLGGVFFLEALGTGP